MRKVAVTTSSFGEFDNRPIEILKENNDILRGFDMACEEDKVPLLQEYEQFLT